VVGGMKNDDHLRFLMESVALIAAGVGFFSFRDVAPGRGGCFLCVLHPKRPGGITVGGRGAGGRAGG